MTDETNTPTDAAQVDDTQAVPASEMPVNILGQYIRDVSFENPNAPDSIKAVGGQPDMDVNIGLDARKLPDEENTFEVVLSARAEALSDGDVLFICEIQYGMVVQIDASVPEDRHHPLLFIEMPRQAFPFVRQIVASLVSQGGFPPLYLSPVDFHALYMQRFGEEIEANKAAAEAGGETKV